MENAVCWADRVRRVYASLRRSEQKVASYALENSETLAGLTISELAARTGVSQPTVIRFVRALGFAGYREFKRVLLRESGHEEERPQSFEPLCGYDLKPWERLEDLPLKTVRVAAGMLDETLKSLCAEELKRAVELLAGAKIIDLYAVENSMTPAQDLLTKLTYLGMNCRLHTDAYLRQISATHLGAGDVALAFSHSGCSVDTVKALKQAQKAGASTIAVSGQRAPMMAKYADVCLCVGNAGTSIYGNAIFSRIPDLAVVDMLYMGVILSDFERFSRCLDRSGAVIAERGYPEEA